MMGQDRVCGCQEDCLRGHLLYEVQFFGGGRSLKSEYMWNCVYESIMD
jgi:hypothetical protein